MLAYNRCHVINWIIRVFRNISELDANPCILFRLWFVGSQKVPTHSTNGKPNPRQYQDDASASFHSMLLIVMFDTKIHRQYLFSCFQLDLTDAVVARLLAYIYESEQQSTMKTSIVITFLALSFLSLFVNASDRSRRLGMMSKKKKKIKTPSTPSSPPPLQAISVANTDADASGDADAGGDATAEADASDLVMTDTKASSFFNVRDGNAFSSSLGRGFATSGLSEVPIPPRPVKTAASFANTNIGGAGNGNVVGTANAIGSSSAGTTPFCRGMGCV
jgi:hypothetical protein